MNLDNSGDFNSPSNPPSQPAPRSIAKIAEALSKAQAEVVQPEKNKTVEVQTKSGHKYKFDYADYSAIVESVRIPLSKNGIAFTHLIETDDRGALVLFTRLIHSSGEYLESAYPLPRSTDPKELGGAITYGKRYCLSAITGCVADDDADAEPKNVTNLKDKEPKKTPPPPAQKPQPQAPEAPPKTPIVTPSQLARLFAIANKNGWTNEQIKIFMERYYGIGSTKDLSRGQYDELVDIVQKKAFDQAVSPLDTFGPDFGETGSNG